MGTKEWWKSKAVWTGILTVLIAAYTAYRTSLNPHLPEIPEWFYAILGTFGIVFRLSANTTLTK